MFWISILIILVFFAVMVFLFIDSWPWKLIWIGLVAALWFFQGIHLAVPAMAVLAIAIFLKSKLPQQSKM